MPKTIKIGKNEKLIKTSKIDKKNNKENKKEVIGEIKYNNQKQNKKENNNAKVEYKVVSMENKSKAVKNIKK